jgi:cyclase
MNKNSIRIISILEIKNGLLIKGINLEGLRVLGEAKNFSKYYYESGIDEVCYIDNVASLYGTSNLTKFITNTAENIFIPLSVGGGIKNIQDIENILRSGADKVCINTSIVNNINFLKKASKIFGASTITVQIQFICIDNKYFISTSNGRDLVSIHPLDWAKKIQDYGAGEILLTSVNNEGLQQGFDVNITKLISDNISIPVIAYGGAGSFNDVLDVIKHTSITGVGISSLFHYDAIKFLPISKNINIGNSEYLNNVKRIKKKKNKIKELKMFLRSKKVLLRNE